MSSKKTTAEFLAELQQDEEFQRKQRERDAKLEKRRIEAAKEQKSIVSDLGAVGVYIDSVWDLVNTSEPYFSALPILIEHLDKPYSQRTKEGIIRAITVEPAKGLAGNKLLKMFRSESDDNLRWVIGNALSRVATEKEITDVLDLLGQAKYGYARSELVHAVARIQGNQGIDLLISLLDDEDVFAQTIIALGNLKAHVAKEKIAKFADHNDSWVRNQVSKALSKIG